MRSMPLDTMGLRQLVYADGATAYTLPSPPLQIAQLPMGFEVQLVDNTGTFATGNMVVTGSIGQVASTTVTLNVASAVTTFSWAGDRWIYHQTS